jgi:hypothetical protein
MCLKSGYEVGFDKQKGLVGSAPGTGQDASRTGNSGVLDEAARTIHMSAAGSFALGGPGTAAARQVRSAALIAAAGGRGDAGGDSAEIRALAASIVLEWLSAEAASFPQTLVAFSIEAVRGPSVAPSPSHVAPQR